MKNELIDGEKSGLKVVKHDVERQSIFVSERYF